MKEYRINDVNIYDSDAQRFRRGELEISDGIFKTVGYTSYKPEKGLDYIIPGLVDVHTHGRGGYDFDTASPEGLAEMKKSYAAVGTTTVMATLATSTLECWLEAIDKIKAAGYPGIHLEGRYINEKRLGAHDRTLLAPLDYNELIMLLERMRPLPVHVTAALELEGGEAFCRAALSRGATVGIGHSDTTFAEAERALLWGASSFTHTFNAMKPLHHREPGTVSASLMSDAWSEFICDGFHIAPEVIALAWKIKRHDRFVLITDSMMATGFGDGDFTIGGLPVRVRNSIALTSDGTIAGSTLNLFTGMVNLIKFAGVGFEEAVACATVNPAKMVGFDGFSGYIKEGRAADFCAVRAGDGDYKLKYAVCGGNTAE